MRLATTIPAFALAVSAPAHAGRHQVDYVYDGQLVAGPDWDRVTGADGVPSFGLAAGYAVLRNRTRVDLQRHHRLGVVVDAGWTRGQRTTRFATFTDDEDAAGSDAAFGQRFVLDQAHVGGKLDVDVGNVWYPYVHVTAGLGVATVRLDDDPNRDANPNELVARGVAPTGTFTVGMELLVPDRKLDVPATAALYVEAGWRQAGPLRVGALGGPLDLSGAVVRAGVGVRF